MAVKTYFITGATGAVGSAIVPLLLCDSDVQLRLLIRARDQQHLDERMYGLCQFWELKYGDIQERVKAIQGDMALDRFGMGQDAYETLTNECTHIIHCGGVVRMNLPIEDARKAARGSCKNIISLAEDCKKNGLLQKIEFVSTVGVAGRLSGLVPEQWITKPRSFHNTYEQAKAEAEILVAQKVVEGLPITVHRPSMVVGDSKTGKIIHFQVFYHLCEFLSGRRTHGIIPRIHDVQLDTIPVDYVAKVIILSSTMEEWSGEILHLCSGPNYAEEISSLIQLVRLTFANHGKQLPRQTVIPLTLFKKSIPLLKPFISSMTRRAVSTLPFFFEYLEEKQSFANAGSQKLIGHERFNLPIPEVYLTAVLKYYLEKTSKIHKKNGEFV